jgi:hypothetical protein
VTEAELVGLAWAYRGTTWLPEIDGALCAAADLFREERKAA